MQLSIIFLISCVLTARFFEKRKMKAAAMAYSVVFIIVLMILTFAVDIPLVQTALTNLLGAENYRAAHECISEAINTTLYGVSMFGVLCTVFIVQVTAAILHAATAVVKYCFAKKALDRKFKKAYFKLASTARSLFIPKRINILYCRMLN